MPIKPITMRYLWSVFTGILTTGVLVAAAIDTAFSGISLAVGVYAVAAAVSITCRWKSIKTTSWFPVAGAGISSAAIPGTALATIFTPGAELATVEATGIYLMLGIWILMIDMVYREIELGYFRKRWADTAGE